MDYQAFISIFLKNKTKNTFQLNQIYEQYLNVTKNNGVSFQNHDFEEERIPKEFDLGVGFFEVLNFKKQSFNSSPSFGQIATPAPSSVSQAAPAVDLFDLAAPVQPPKPTSLPVQSVPSVKVPTPAQQPAKSGIVTK